MRISNIFTFYNQTDNFSSFYDCNSSNWLLKFESQDQDEFTKALEACGVNIVQPSDTYSEITTKVQKPELSEKPVFDNVNKEDLLSDSSESKQRANILNRMARMGQAILPKPEMKNTSTELSDSDFDEKAHERRIPPQQVKRAATEKIKQGTTEKLQQTIQSSNLESKVMSNSNIVDNNQQYQSLSNELSNSQTFPNQLYNNQIVPSQVLYNTQQVSNQLMNPQIIPSQMYHPNWANDGYNQYIIAQNAELKINLAQISAKLDTALNLKRTDDEDVDKMVLLSRLKTIKLKTENLEKALQKSEESNCLLRRKNEELETELQNTSGVESKNKEIYILENTVSELKLKLQETQEKSQKIILEIKTWKTKAKEQEDVIEMQRNQLKEYSKLQNENENIQELNETISSLNETVDILKLKLKDFEEYYEKTESEKKVAAQADNNNVKSFEGIVKRHMNEMYQSILDDFESTESHTYSEIQKSIARHLKTASFKIIENCDNIFKKNNVLEE